MAAVVLRTKICLFKYVHLYISMHASIHKKKRADAVISLLLSCLLPSPSPSLILLSIDLLSVLIFISLLSKSNTNFAVETQVQDFAQTLHRLTTEC